MVVLVTGLLSGMWDAAAADLSLPGPCSWKSSSATLATEGGRRVPLTLTLPACGPDAALPFGPPPFPVLLLYSGFMNKASWYWRLAQRAASWGVVVIQYDLPSLGTTVASEVALVPEIARWVADQSDDAASPLYSLADVGRLAAAGHSRGGKLASLALTTYPDLVKAAYLIDPVDVTRFSPESPDNPSATKALAASGAAVGIAGAGRVGSCNPEGSNFEQFWGAAGNGSWLGVETGSSHAQFSDGGCLVNAASDLLCGRGTAGRAAVAELTATQLLAWLWEQLEGQAADGGYASPSPLPAFYGWAQQQVDAGRLQFEVKGDEVGAWEEEAAPAPDEPVGAAVAATSEQEEAACKAVT